MGVDLKKTEDVLFQIFRELAAEQKKPSSLSTTTWGNPSPTFEQLLLLNRELVAFGPREQVLTTANMTRALRWPCAVFSRTMWPKAEGRFLLQQLNVREAGGATGAGAVYVAPL